MHKPNVVVVLTDQLGAFALGCYGNSAIRTPNVDRLAEQGVRFELGVTNNPVCTPARSSLLSGQYGRTCTGEVGNVAGDPPHPARRRLPDPTLADVLRRVGYDTALIGKWHVDPSPLAVGFESAYFPLIMHRYRGQRFFEGDRLGPAVDGFAPAHEMERVEAYLAARGEAPFFLFYNISLPHMPIGPAELPARYVNAYDPASLPLRGNVFREGAMAHDEKWFKVYRVWDYFWRVWGPCWNAGPEYGYPEAVGELPSDALPEGFDLRDLTALYYGATTCVDDLVGRLMDALEANGLAENTILLFTSDHGDNLGSHHLFNKDCLYEESIRIPFMVRYPEGIAPAENGTQIAQLIDVMPTVLELCGVETPDTVQGRSLAPVLRGEVAALPGNAAFIETPPFHFGRPCVGVRTPTHLYGAYLAADGREMAEPWGFYDLRDDPLQERNLIETGAQAARAAELHAQLTAWHEGTPWLVVGR